MSPLFKKKEKIQAPVLIIEKPIEYTLESLEHRFALLLKSEKKVEGRIAKLQQEIYNLLQQSRARVKEVIRGGESIEKEYVVYREQCNTIIKGIALTAKKEDFEKIKRFIDQYDFADMITREEFERLI